jgi:SAM-dependent methyltransferase
MNDKSFDKYYGSTGEISGTGERVSHLYPNDVYYAHLSIYLFALQFCHGKTVLDAGSGAGYGSAYLVENGAHSVDAFDIEEKAVSFSRHHFSRSNLTYHVMSIEKITGFPKQHFDVVFSSNALEHVPNVLPFFRSSWELLKPDGTLIIAVPPIVNDLLRQSNLDNPYHLNIWSPHQWFHVLNLFFSEIQPYLHRLGKSGLELNFANTPEQTHINETDFIFEPISVDDFYRHNTLTAIFIAQKPRTESELPPPDSILSFIDDSFTRSPADIPQNLTTGEQSSSPYSAHLVRLIKRAKKILRQDGLIALMQQTIFYLIASFQKIRFRSKSFRK